MCDHVVNLMDAALRNICQCLHFWASTTLKTSCKTIRASDTHRYIIMLWHILVHSGEHRDVEDSWLQSCATVHLKTPWNNIGRQRFLVLWSLFGSKLNQCFFTRLGNTGAFLWPCQRQFTGVPITTGSFMTRSGEHLVHDHLGLSLDQSRCGHSVYGGEYVVHSTVQWHLFTVSFLKTFSALTVVSRLFRLATYDCNIVIRQFSNVLVESRQCNDVLTLQSQVG